MSEYAVRQTLLERWLVVATKGMAISGGMLFILLIVMSLVSIISRKFGYGSVNGDIELMQAGCAVAVTAFFPYCTLFGEHLKVDFFTSQLRPQRKRTMDGLCDLLLGLVSLVLAWYTAISVMDTLQNQEVTPLVSLPLWIPQMLLIPGLALMAFAALYRGVISLLTARTLPEAYR